MYYTYVRMYIHIPKACLRYQVHELHDWLSNSYLFVPC